MREDPESRRLKPSRQKSITGYRTDSERHRDARLKIPAERRREIARMGGEAFRLKSMSKTELRAERKRLLAALAEVDKRLHSRERNAAREQDKTNGEASNA